VIKYELGLTVIGLVVFWVWQTVSLRRDMRRTREADEATASRDETPPGEDAPPH
jgi:hypothetical protein